jgi:uncharacterized protein (TIGR02118 family)
MKVIACLVLVCLTAGLIGCKSGQSNSASIRESGLFKVTIMYPDGEGKTFDMTYYEQKHMPMVAAFLGANLRFYEIDKGLTGRTAADKATFAAIGYFYIKDVEEYNKAVGRNRDAIISDFKNYTNIQPVIQISEVRQVVTNPK